MKIFFAPLNGILGHTLRTGRVAHSVGAADRDIAVSIGVTSQDSAYMLAMLAPKARLIDTLPLVHNYGPSTGGQSATSLLSAVRAARRALERDREILAAERPDLVVIDMRWSAAIAAAQLGIPRVQLTSTIWSRYRAEWVDASPALAEEAAALRLFLRLLNRRLGEQLLSETAPILLDDRHLPIIRDPRDASLLGGAVFTSLGEPLRAPHTTRPVALVMRGSTGRFDARAVATALEAHGFTVALAEAGAGTALVDVRPALARADVVVCHGGAGSAYLALSYGVPLVALPTNADQAVHAEAFRRVGVCRVASDAGTAPDLALAVLQDESFAGRSEQWAESCTRDGPERAAATILALTGRC